MKFSQKETFKILSNAPLINYKVTNAMVTLIKNNTKTMPQGVIENEDGTEKQKS